MNGTRYQSPCGLIIDVKDEEPVIGKVHNVLVDGQEVYFEVELMDATYSEHFHAFIVSHSISLQHFLIRQFDLVTHQPYGLYYCLHIPTTSHSHFCILRSTYRYHELL